MKQALCLSLLLLATPRIVSAQMGGSFGGSASQRSQGSSDYAAPQTPAAMERFKRQPTLAEQRDTNATFLEASILMNVKAEEYIAVFGVMKEGKTPDEATTRVDAAIASFKASLASLGVKEDEQYVDFVTQNRIYAFQSGEKSSREVMVGFELKKNISIHFKDKNLVDSMVLAAAKAEIYDLIKVDYVVKDRDAIQARLQAQTMAIIRQKWDRYQTALGVQLSQPTQVLVDKPNVYFPIELYSSYTAAETETVTRYEGNHTIINARKSRTTFFNALDGEGYDSVINPVVVEPTVQFTTYIKVKCDPAKTRKK